MHLQLPSSPRTTRRRRALVAATAGAAALLPVLAGGPAAGAALVPPVLADPELVVHEAVGGLARPIALAFLPDGSSFVLEKGTGKVQHVVDGRVTATVLDLDVNSNPLAPNAERGLLGIALHPDFPTDPGVYLSWIASDTAGLDTAQPYEAPLLAHRIDRFTWDGERLAHDRPVARLRARRDDTGSGSAERGGHHGGVLRFGPDRMLYAVVGDVGRRGALQNLACGPTTACPGPVVPDDRYGGPEPDDAHLTGVVLRLAPDGSAPPDNPFSAYGASVGGQVGANLQKVFAYGIRNSFGLAFDPRSGALWDQENGEDGYDEINRVEAGSNSGWVQLMGPVSRYADWRALEVDGGVGVGETRYPVTTMATTAAGAIGRLVALPGSRYSDPEFSWRHGPAPAGIGFVVGRGLGPQYDGDLLVGVARYGALLRLQLTGNRRAVAVDDPRLEDRVADNTSKNDRTESESLLFGTGFGTVSDVQTGPDGDVYVVDHSREVVWRIGRR